MFNPVVLEMDIHSHVVGRSARPNLVEREAWSTVYEGMSKHRMTPSMCSGDRHVSGPVNLCVISRRSARGESTVEYLNYHFVDLFSPAISTVSETRQPGCRPLCLSLRMMLGARSNLHIASPLIGANVSQGAATPCAKATIRCMPCSLHWDSSKLILDYSKAENFRFLELAAEIRNRIYFYICGDQDVYVCCVWNHTGSVMSSMEFGPPIARCSKNTRTLAMHIMLANRQVSAEASSVYYSTSRFRFDAPRTVLNYLALQPRIDVGMMTSVGMRFSVRLSKHRTEWEDFLESRWVTWLVRLKQLDLEIEINEPDKERHEKPIYRAIRHIDNSLIFPSLKCATLVVNVHQETQQEAKRKAMKYLREMRDFVVGGSVFGLEVTEVEYRKHSGYRHSSKIYTGEPKQEDADKKGKAAKSGKEKRGGKLGKGTATTAKGKPSSKVEKKTAKTGKEKPGSRTKESTATGGKGTLVSTAENNK